MSTLSTLSEQATLSEQVTEQAVHEHAAHRRARRARLALALVALALLLPGGRAARAGTSVTVDYSAVAAFSQTTPYTTSGLTATPAAGETLTGGGGPGLGIAGGTSFHGFDAIDQSEVTKLYA